MYITYYIYIPIYIYMYKDERNIMYICCRQQQYY